MVLQYKENEKNNVSPKLPSYFRFLSYVGY